MRKLIWGGIVLGLVPFLMGVACGGYAGWPGLSTSGTDAKISQELSISSSNALESGLWTFYTNYNNIGQQRVNTVSTYVDHTAPPGVFTSDGLGEQHFNDHVGVQVAAANDRNKDGVVCWQGCPLDPSGDYTIPNGLCPAVGGTGTTSSSNGFQAYCDKGVWMMLVATTHSAETKQSSPGSKYSNALGGGSNFSPVTIGQILASSTLIPDGSGGITVTVNALSVPDALSVPIAASHTLSTPITFNAYGFGQGIAINAGQAGLVEAANWLASQWAGQPDGAYNVTLTFNGGAASSSVTMAGGNSAAIVLQNFAATH